MRFGKGPRMAEEELFEALNLDHPGLEAVRAAAQKLDWPAAETAFAAYIRAREKPVWHFD